MNNQTEGKVQNQGELRYEPVVGLPQHTPRLTASPLNAVSSDLEKEDGE